MDEKPYQLLDEALNPIPMKPQKPERQDSEYIRKGTCSIFIFTEPLAGLRHVNVRERRTRVDKELVILTPLTILTKEGEYVHQNNLQVKPSFRKI